MKKNLIPLLILIFTILLIFVLKNNDKGVPANIPIKPEKIKIAACPTCFEAAQKLDSEKYQVIPTASTAESAALLAKESVDMILAGRTLRSNESASDFLILANGYSFLSNKTITAYTSELKHAIIYTDIELKKVQQELPEFLFETVDDVYQYLEKGIVLTTWDNTDYARAEIVHVFEENGERLAMSRRPTLYCPTNCDEETAGEIKSVFD